MEPEVGSKCSAHVIGAVVLMTLLILSLSANGAVAGGPALSKASWHRGTNSCPMARPWFGAGIERRAHDHRLLRGWISSAISIAGRI